MEVYKKEKKNSKKGSRSIGYPACVGALVTTTRVVTGATLIKLGTVGQLEIDNDKNENRMTLQGWFRSIRQGRFTPDE